MKKIHLKVRNVFLFVLCCFFFFSYPLNDNIFGDESAHSQMFKKYKIPVEMQKAPMFDFLQRMEWQYKVAQSESWFRSNASSCNIPK